MKKLAENERFGKDEKKILERELTENGMMNLLVVYPIFAVSAPLVGCQNVFCTSELRYNRRGAGNCVEAV